ncbi:DUF6264 family protein [Paramicrobacterium chengjingii]|uniref:Uncharacterized protein n=1 Tax=Paramicrobacterium chengjingii TaxID=2769067 RepID=A0ABX6YLA9_9MICO|nr:DUF6264 family protein [Microbacterium chengjingii]QPZ39561.1 hypothetical protein HCR76_05760 [Microbacterium chengjingii]
MSDNEPSDPDRPERPRFGEYSNEKPARPQFGEYASPEEQRAAIRVPATEDNESVPIESHGDEKKTPEHADRLHPHMPANRHPQAKSTMADDDPVAEARRRTDRFSTFLLLGVGLFSVLSTAPSLLQLPRMLTEAYSQFGMGEYTNTSLGTTIGWVILVIYAGLWIAALVLSLRRLAARKRTWWVPFVIGVVANLVYIILLTVAMVNDPAFMQYVNGMSG